MLKKILVATAALLFVTAPMASAQGYGDDDTVTTSDSTPAPGQLITLQAKTFVGPVTFTLFSAPVVLGTVNADSAGVATLTTAIPADTTPGSHRIEATGTGVDGQPLTVTTAITVTGAGGTGGSGSGNLPTTGTDSAVPMTQVAIGAIAAGGLLLILGKRRASRSEPARETAGV